MLYRIYTENKNKRDVLALASGYFPGFTVFEGQGYWQGAAENSLVLEIVAPRTKKSEVESLAKTIKDVNTQEAVLLQEIKNSSWLI